MIYKAMCPVCNMTTRFEDGQAYISCGCGVPYTITEATDSVPVEDQDQL